MFASLLQRRSKNSAATRKGFRLMVAVMFDTPVLASVTTATIQPSCHKSNMCDVPNMNSAVAQSKRHLISDQPLHPGGLDLRLRHTRH